MAATESPHDDNFPKLMERFSANLEQFSKNPNARKEVWQKLDQLGPGECNLKLHIRKLELEKDEHDLDRSSWAVDFDMGVLDRETFVKFSCVHLERSTMVVQELDIERAFDNGDIAIVPFDASQPITRWKTVLTNYSRRNSEWNWGHTLGSLEEKELVSVSDHRPASRFLYFKFITTLLRCRADRRPGWEDLWEKFQSGKPWATPAKYPRKSMLLTLAKDTGDLEEAEIDGLIKEHIFEPAALAPSEVEAEVARRVQEIFLAHQQRSEGDEDRVEDDEDDEDSDEDE
ncbi:MAG: hypothetical protein M1829_002313 [Trizodia sp. TS-e1964]|nr:MAG: hypothetical protein M1829_002313 [Trizodia sp. TS-e1964]